MRERRGERRWK